MNSCRYASDLERHGTSAAAGAARRHATVCEQCQAAVARYLAFEAELEVAGRVLAAEPLPTSTLTAARALRHDGRSVARRLSLAAAAAIVVVLAVAVGTMVGALIERQPSNVGVGPDRTDETSTLVERVRGFEEQIRLHNLNPAAVVRLSEDYAVAAAAGPNRVRVMELYLLENGRPHARELAGGERFRAGPTLLLQTMSGNTEKEWNTVFHGTAPPNVSRVVIDGFDAEGGQVVDQAWVIMLREKGVQPGDLHWRFIDEAGNTVLSGTGITPDAGR